MKPQQIFSRLLTIFVLLTTVLGLPAMDASAAETGSSLPSSASVEQFLNPDGTLNLSSGFSGNVELGSYSVALDPKLGPVLSQSGNFASNYQWKALGTTPLSGKVYILVADGTTLYAGGAFQNAGGDPNADYIAKWNGSAWSSIGNTPLNGTVTSIAISGTDLYVGGYFTDAGGNPNADKITKWNGTSWSALGSAPLNGDVNTIAASDTDIYVGGSFTDAGGITAADYIAKWNGSSWSALGNTWGPAYNYEWPYNITSRGHVYKIKISGSSIYVGGDFEIKGGAASNYFVKWDGANWSAVGPTNSINSRVRDIEIDGEDIYISGEFTRSHFKIRFTDHMIKATKQKAL